MKHYIVVFVVLWVKCFGKELPSFIHVCHQKDPNIEKCIIEAVEYIRPYLVTGDSEYNIPSIEPLIIKDFIKEESSGITLTATDVVAYGGSNFSVTNLTVNMQSKKFTFDVELPELKILAHYNIEGRILVLQLKGNGNFYGNVTNCKARATFQTEHYEGSGGKHLRFISDKMKIRIGSGQVRLDNLFGGEKILSGVINESLNKNLQVFLKELMPIIEKALAAEFLNIANKIVEQFTVEQLFPN